MEMSKSAHGIHLVATAIALTNAAAGVFAYAKVALGFEPGRVGLTSGETVDLALWTAAVPIIAAILWCSIRLRKCSLRRAVWLTVAWTGLYSWVYWFGSSPAWQMYELHTLDPDLIGAERLRHLVWVGGLYAMVVALFALLPLLKFLQLRREVSRDLPV
jgi:hypothetical protein